MLSPVRLSVCLSSVTLVRPTQPVEIFGNFSSAFGTLAINWHPRKILRRTLGRAVGVGLNARRVAKYSDFYRTWTYVHVRYMLLPFRLSVVCRLWRWCTLLSWLKFSAFFSPHDSPGTLSFLMPKIVRGGSPFPPKICGESDPPPFLA